MNVYASRPRWQGERPRLRLRLSVHQRAELRGNTAGDRCRLAAGLEAGEVGAVSPGEGTTQPHARLHGGVVNDIDGALVIRRALTVAGEVAQVTARREDGRHAR